MSRAKFFNAIKKSEKGDKMKLTIEKNNGTKLIGEKI